MMTRSQRSGRQRRSRRYPAGWLRVEVQEGGSGRVLAGRLVDTAKGGLGLVLQQPLPLGARAQVTRGGEEEEAARDWERREARVAHATELRDGSWRVGLAFPPRPPSELQMWATRLLLLIVFLVAAIATSSSAGGPAMAAGAIAALTLALEIGAEWQYRSEQRHYRELLQEWEAAPPPSYPPAIAPRVA